jgi:UDP-glucuronate 4-epimerase
MVYRKNSGNLVITGAAGFIGTSVRLRCIAGGQPYTGLDLFRGHRLKGEAFLSTDIRSEDKLRRLATSLRTETLLHLAAVSTAITPFNGVGNLMTTNVIGTWNLLKHLRPKKVVFASSCTVYGSRMDKPASPGWQSRCPVGLYGASKLDAELLIRDWALLTGGCAVIFRFGNVVGANCRGLIPYLVQHALSDTAGQPARMRAQGKVVRDYVPVEHVARLLIAAAQRSWPDGSVNIFNIGTGIPTSNGDIARIVKRRLKQKNLSLAIRFDDPLSEQESIGTLLNVSATADVFGIPTPTARDIRSSVIAAVDSYSEGKEC